MNKLRLPLFIASAMLALSQSALAASFVVQDIRVVGTQRVALSTVLANIPLKRGETYKDYMTADIVGSLYKTGLFSDVNLEQVGNVLVVNVLERTAVGEINISGNKAFKTPQIIAGLNKLGLRRGLTLNKVALSQAEHQIKQQYLAMGKYGVDVKVDTKPLARGRVAVNIVINEGLTSRITQVNITGNKAYSDAVLRRLMETGTRSLNPFSDRDKYSQQRLHGDREKITSFYRDQGYLHFEITDSNVGLTPDKKSMIVNIAIREGDRYRIGKVDVSSVKGITAQQAQSVLTMREGQVFSQKRLEASRKALRQRIAKGGHAFARVGLNLKVDEARNLVNIDFQSEQGKRVYVRRINIGGNYRTKDIVYRREMRQLESSWYSREKVARSKARIQRLPYVQSVKIRRVEVAGVTDQVDLEVTIKEQLSNQFNAGLGYSQNGGITFNLGLKQQNFLGSGKSLGVSASNSSATKRLSVSYFNPYHTIEGVGRGFDVYYNATDTSENDLISNYISDTYGARLNYTLPMGENNSFRFSLGYEHREIKTTTNSPAFIRNFVAANGSVYDELLGTVSYVHDTRDRSIFPTKGNKQSLALEAGLPGSDLEYYKLKYRAANYWPVTSQMSFALKGALSYGGAYGGTNKELPFFERFYSGGIGSVRGFKRNTLGVHESGDAVGGDFSAATTAELLFPVPFMADNKALRMSIFADAGNVFSSTGAFEADELRYSVGVGATWLSPMGPLTLSYAKPMNVSGDDEEEEVQFSIGANF
ncbi:MAG: outer membrane protein assembly factor BamA [Thiotrichaceae bacterium]|nr:outer membrane protein assembly factor BamA [Thiotrichaceae bacterium]